MTLEQTNPPTPPPAPSLPMKPRGSLPFLVWGAALMLGGMGIGAGATMLVRHHGPPPHGLMQPPDFRPGPFVDEMTEELKLTPDQSQKVKDAYGTSLTAIQGLRQDMIVKLEAQHDKLRDSLRQILTPLQFAQWDQMYSAERARMMPGEPPPRGPRDGREGPGGELGDRDHRGGPGFGGPGFGPGGPGGRGFDGPGRGPGGPDGLGRPPGGDGGFGGMGNPDGAGLGDGTATQPGK